MTNTSISTGASNSRRPMKPQSRRRSVFTVYDHCNPDETQSANFKKNICWVLHSFCWRQDLVLFDYLSVNFVFFSMRVFGFVFCSQALIQSFLTHLLCEVCQLLYIGAPAGIFIYLAHPAIFFSQRVVLRCQINLYLFHFLSVCTCIITSSSLNVIVSFFLSFVFLRCRLFNLFIYRFVFSTRSVASTQLFPRDCSV